jgi:hypothetical protein
MNSKYGGLNIRGLTALHGLPHCPAAYKYTYIVKKENLIFLIYKEIQTGAVAKSYIRKGFLIYEEMRKYLVIFEEAVSHIWLCELLPSEFPYIRGKLNFLFYQCAVGGSRTEDCAGTKSEGLTSLTLIPHTLST